MILYTLSFFGGTGGAMCLCTPLFRRYSLHIFVDFNRNLKVVITLREALNNLNKVLTTTFLIEYHWVFTSEVNVGEGFGPRSRQETKLDSLSVHLLKTCLLPLLPLLLCPVGNKFYDPNLLWWRWQNTWETAEETDEDLDLLSCTVQCGNLDYKNGEQAPARYIRDVDVEKNVSHTVESAQNKHFYNWRSGQAIRSARCAITEPSINLNAYNAWRRKTIWKSFRYQREIAYQMDRLYESSNEDYRQCCRYGLGSGCWKQFTGL